jgi:hypothetical protein
MTALVEDLLLLPASNQECRWNGPRKWTWAPSWLPSSKGPTGPGGRAPAVEASIPGSRGRSVDATRNCEGPSGTLSTTPRKYTLRRFRDETGDASAFRSIERTTAGFSRSRTTGSASSGEMLDRIFERPSEPKRTGARQLGKGRLRAGPFHRAPGRREPQGLDPGLKAPARARSFRSGCRGKKPGHPRPAGSREVEPWPA